jgi:hypothetical protein
MQLGDVSRGEEANAHGRRWAGQEADALRPSHTRHEPVRDQSSPYYYMLIVI